jgi:hypothetical protein
VLPIPFAVRLAVGVVLAAVAGHLAFRADPAGGRRDTWIGESLLIVALTVANPTLWVTALSMLIAIVPLRRTPAVSPAGAGAAVAVGGSQ